MKKIVLLPTQIAQTMAAAPKAEARTRVAISFNYGSPYPCYRPAHAYPVVIASTYSRYRYKRFHPPYYSPAYFQHRPHTRFVVKSCY